MKWIIAVIVFSFAFWMLLVPLIVSGIWRPEYFITVHRVHVEDGVVGQPIKIVADRTVHRDFVSDRFVQLRKLEGSKYALHCRRIVRDVPSTKDSVFPANMHLNRWLGIPPNAPCEIGAGTYQLLTEYRIHWMLWSKVRFKVETKPFVVRGPGEIEVPKQVELDY